MNLGFCVIPIYKFCTQSGGLPFKPNAVIGFVVLFEDLAPPEPKGRGEIYKKGHQRPEMAILDTVAVLMVFYMHALNSTFYEKNTK